MGFLITTEEHIEAIHDGLLKEYDSFITSTMLRFDPYTVEDVELLLLTQEERFEKNNISAKHLFQANTTFLSIILGPMCLHQTRVVVPFVTLFLQKIMGFLDQETIINLLRINILIYKTLAYNVKFAISLDILHLIIGIATNKNLNMLFMEFITDKFGWKTIYSCHTNYYSWSAVVSWHGARHHLTPVQFFPPKHTIGLDMVKIGNNLGVSIKKYSFYYVHNATHF